MSLIIKEPEKIYKPTHKEVLMHQSWCFKNSIFIYAQHLSWREVRILIDDNGDEIIGAHVYYQTKLKAKDEKYWEVIWKLYTEYYLRSNPR